MKFYDRLDEKEAFVRIRELSKNNAQFTLLVGRRRIGKTALLYEVIKDTRSLYFFVSKKSESLLCEEFQYIAERILGIKIFGEITRFKDLFEQLMAFSIDNPFTLVIDEFQDFERANKAICSEIQEIWDKYKDKAKINFIVCGSIYSLLTKIFEDNKEPLFGRLTSKMVLRPFSVKTIKNILKDYNPNYTDEDLLCLYMITGGVPKYISLLMDAECNDKDSMIDFVCSNNSVFLTEGEDVLVSEFGREYGNYFSILQLIATGKTSQPEIDGVIGKNTGAYLQKLEIEYSLIERRKPMFSKMSGRNIKWQIKDEFLAFWFRFIYKNQSIVEMGRWDLLKERINEGYEQYSGLILEEYFRTKIKEESRMTEVGSFWDRKGENEIDIVAVSDIDKNAYIAEVKRNKDKISIYALREKKKAIEKDLDKYEVEYLALSMEDM